MNRTEPIVIFQALLGWWLLLGAITSFVAGTARFGSGFVLLYTGNVQLGFATLALGHLAALGITAAVAVRLLRGDLPAPGWRTTGAASAVVGLWVLASAGSGVASYASSLLQIRWAMDGTGFGDARQGWIYATIGLQTGGQVLNMALITAVFAVATARAQRIPADE